MARVEARSVTSESISSRDEALITTATGHDSSLALGFAIQAIAMLSP
jgi:hypothetical protein